VPDARRRAAKAAPKRAITPAPKRAGKPSAKRAPVESPARRRRGIVGLGLAAVVLVGLLFAFVYPTRTFLDQRHDTSRARAQLAVLQTETAKLRAEEKRLQDPDEVEKRARQYGLVKPNEQPFVIVPAPTAPPAAEPVATPADAGGAATPSP